MIPYMIGGDHRLAKELAKMLVNHDCTFGDGAALDDENVVIQSDEPTSAYIFDDDDIILGDHHKLTR